MAHAASADRKWRDNSRGREARTPREIPARGWKDILWRVKDEIKEDKLSIIAAGVAFYGLLAIFPGLVALVGLYGLAFDPQQVEQQVSALSGVMPQEAQKILMGQLHDLVTTSSATLSIGAIGGLVLALWSASAGVRTMMEALNVTYDEEETRGFIRFYGTALLLTLGAVAGIVVAIAIVIALPIVINFLGLGGLLGHLIAYARWPILAILALAALAVLYRYGPSRDEPRWQWVSWGAVIATVIWLIGSALFSLYVTSFGNYNQTYGSAGAVVIMLMWFLLSAYAVLIGAEFNAEMERQTKKDTTTGPEKPMGSRRAYAADTLGKSKA